MKFLKITFIALILIIVQSLFASAEEQYEKEEKKYGKDIRERKIEVPTCSKPIATIAARGFKCKAAQCQERSIVFGPNFAINLSPQTLGDGLADMLVSALVKTGCFNVLEREVLEELKQELEMLGVKPQQALQGADILITGSITALETDFQKSDGGGFVIPLPILGGLKLGKNKAYIALDLRLVDVKKGGVVISAKTVEGISERWNVAVGGGGLVGTVAAGGWFELVKNTPLEEAIRDLIAQAVTLIVEDIKGYYARSSLPEQGSASSNQVKTSTEVATTGGGLQRAEVAFTPGNTLVWQEDFSKCDVVPKDLKIVEGSVECVGFSGKRWLAGVKGNTWVEKTIPNWDLSKDWALEFEFYISNQFFGDKVIVSIGAKDSPYTLAISGGDEGSQWSGKPLPDIPKPAAKSVHHVAVQKKGDNFFIFFNGKRIYTTSMDNLILSRMQKSLFFSLGSGNTDISADRYVLITNIKLTQY